MLMVDCLFLWMNGFRSGTQEGMVLTTTTASNAITTLAYVFGTLGGAQTSALRFDAGSEGHVVSSFKYACWSATVPLTILSIGQLGRFRRDVLMRAAGLSAVGLTLATTVLHVTYTTPLLAVVGLTVSFGIAGWFLTILFNEWMRVRRELTPRLTPIVDGTLRDAIILSFFVACSLFVLMFALLLSEAIPYEAYEVMQSGPFARSACAVVDVGCKGVLLVVIAYANIVDNDVMAAASIFRRSEDAARNVQAHRRFLRFISHELRIPLASMTMGTELLKTSSERLTRKLDRGADPATLIPRFVGKLDGTLQAMQHAGYALSSLVDDILSLAKIEAGKLELRMEAFSVTEAVRSVVFAMTGLSRSRHVRIVCQLPRHMPDMIGDHVRVSQVVANFVSNAIKFSSAGAQVTVAVSFREVSPADARAFKAGVQADETLRTEAVQLEEVSVDNPDAQWALVTVRVVDKGVGIAEAEIKRIFKPFYQIDAGVQQKGRGTGMGLAIAKGIVEHHGGRVGVVSEGDGLGSAFSFTIPMEIALEESARGSVGAASRSGAAQNVVSDVVHRSVDRVSALRGTAQQQKDRSERAAERSRGGRSASSRSRGQRTADSTDDPENGSAASRSVQFTRSETGSVEWSPKDAGEGRRPGWSDSGDASGDVSGERTSVGPLDCASERASHSASEVGSLTVIGGASEAGSGKSPEEAGSDRSRGSADPEGRHRDGGGSDDRQTPAAGRQGATAGGGGESVTAEGDGGGRESGSDSDSDREAAPSAQDAGAGRAASEAERGRRDAPSPRPLRVLVVDDVPSNSDFLAEMLEAALEEELGPHAQYSVLAGRSALEVDIVENGREALAQLEAARQEGRSYDLMTLDKEMPILDGYKTARKLRARGFVLPVIGITANALSEDIDRFLFCGATMVLTKPVRLNVLKERVIEALEMADETMGV